MRKGMTWNSWLMQFAVAGGYALGYVLFRNFSFSHWSPLMGFRLICLLLLPRRYWGALIIGEMIPLAYGSKGSLETWGLAWAIYNVLPPIALAMPVVWAFRKGLPMAGSKRVLNMGSFLLCTTSVSIIWAVSFYATFKLMRMQPGYALPSSTWLITQYFLGNYLGILTVTPSMLVVIKALRDRSENIEQHRVTANHLWLDSVCLLLPPLALLTWIGVAGTPEVRQIARMAMFLPVVWFARRHGWQGTALAGAAASVAIMLAMPAAYDIGTLQAEVFIAFAMTALLLLGSYITVLHDRERQDRLESRTMLQLAQQELYRGELRMHRASVALEQVGEAMQQTYERLLDRLRHVVTPTEEQFHQRQSQVTRQQVYRLADNLYPRVWEKRGLSAAMCEGAIAQAMQSISIDYECRLMGGDPGQLDPRIQMALYRLSCEVVAYLLAQDAFIRIVLILRSGETHGRRWAVLRVKGDRSFNETALLRQQEQELLRSRLGANGLPLWTIRDQARLYGGDLHLRITPEDFRVTALLQEAMAA